MAEAIEKSLINDAVKTTAEDITATAAEETRVLKISKGGGIDNKNTVMRVGAANGLTSMSVDIQAWGGFKAFLEDLKGFAGWTAKGGVEEAEKLIKSVDTQIKSVDDALKSVPITKSPEGFLKVGDETVGSIHKILREGDLEAVLRAAKRTDIPVTPRDSAAYKTLLGETPERAMKDLDDVATVNKRNLSQLDSTVENLDKLSKQGKKDLQKVQSNFFKKFKQGATVTLTIGAVVVAVDWLAKATEARKGCFMLTMLNNKTSSCKVKAYSCVGGDKGSVFCQRSLPLYNTTLVMINYASMNDDAEPKKSLAEAAGVTPAELYDKLGECIDKNYEKMAKSVVDSITAAGGPPSLDPCGLKHPKVEDGVIPPCRMCSPSASPVSTQFVDPSQYGENIAFQCITDPSILDTITDIVVTTGQDILDGVNNFVSGTLKPVFIAAAVILVVVLIIYLFTKFAGKKSSDSDNNNGGSTPVIINTTSSTRPSMQQQQQQPRMTNVY